MKAIKIILATVVIAVLCFFSWEICNYVRPNSGDKKRFDQNSYQQTINDSLISLGNKPTDNFCSEFYQELGSQIELYSSQQLFNTNVNSNNEIAEDLRRNLYSVYAEKFVKQAMRVFAKSSWSSSELNFIKGELETLKTSAYLDPSGSAASAQFHTINEILAKYYKIVNFNNYWMNYKCLNYGFNTEFPDLSSPIKQSKAYLNSNMGNSYVNNCTKLKNTLVRIPKTLYNKHVKYLKIKIEKNAGRFTEFESQPQYVTDIYEPLQAQVNSLDGNVYGIGWEIEDKDKANLINDVLDGFTTELSEYFTTLQEKSKPNQP